MKYAIILPDGAADEPLPQLDGRTPLAAAQVPHMDWVAQQGRLARVVTVPDGFVPGTDVATLALFGYDPHQYYDGRAPIEAAAQRLTAREGELIFRCNFVTIDDGRMKSFTADHIDQAEAEALIATLNEHLAGDACTFYSGVSYRNLMVLGGAGEIRLHCAPPHDIPNQPVAAHWPTGPGAERVCKLMERAAEMIAAHPVNGARRAQGRMPVSGIWLWGQGRPTQLPPLAERFGPRGVVITAVDIIRGLAVSMGMDLIEVPGATGFLDTNYAGKGAAAVQALADYDLVVVHVEAPDEAGHLGDADEKVLALERVDEHIVGPVLDALRAHGAFRLMIAPDHPTPVSTTAHSAEPPPVCWAGHGIPAVEQRPFTEADALAGGFVVDPGHTLMERFFDDRPA